MKNSIVLTTFFLITFNLSSTAQRISDLYQIYNPISQSINSSDTTSIFTPYGIIKPGKPVYSVSFGANYTSFGHGMNYSSSTVTPTVAFAPTNKLQIFTGASISRNNLSNLPVNKNVPSSMQQSDGNPTQVFAYGQYQVNNKFSFYAMGSFAKNQLYFSPYYGGVGKADYQQFGVGFNYKLSSKASIGASINFANGTGPLYMGLSPNGFNNYNSMFP